MHLGKIHRKFPSSRELSQDGMMGGKAKGGLGYDPTTVLPCSLPSLSSPFAAPPFPLYSCFPLLEHSSANHSSSKLKHDDDTTMAPLQPRQLQQLFCPMYDNIIES